MSAPAGNLWLRLGRHLGPELRVHWRLLAVGWVCLMGVTAMQLLRPWPLKLIFDEILIPTGEPGWLASSFPALAADRDLMLAAIAGSVLLIAVLAGMFSYASTCLLGSYGQRLLAAARRKLYAHVQRLSHSFHDEHRSGDLLMRLTADVRTLRELVLNAALFMSERGLFLVGMIAIMFWLDWRLTLVALIVLPPLAWAARRMGGRIRGATRRQRKAEGDLASVLSERIGAIKVVQAFTREAHEDDTFSRQEQRNLEAGLEATRLEAGLNRLAEVVLAVGTCAVLWFGVTRVQAAALTPGDLLVFVAYLKSMHKPVRKIAALTARTAKAGACAERVVAVLDAEPEVRDRPGAVTAPAFRGEIRFQGVGFGYGAARPVLEDVSFTIRPGEHLAVVGASGAGKSTLANLLLRFYDPAAGSVSIDGTDIRDYRLDSLRAQIAVVLQESVLFNASVRENIAYGRPDADQEQIREAAAVADALDFIESMEGGFDARVGERGKKLSGGQRQRIAVARAVVRGAPILVLDEPLTGLDPRSRAAVSGALEQLTRGRTVLHITHDLASAAGADRLLVMDAGRVVAVGTHSELQAGCPAYQRLCRDAAFAPSLADRQRGAA